MTNKNLPANIGLHFSSDLSSPENVDDYLNLLFKAKTGRPAKLDFTHLIYFVELKRKYSCETWLGLYRCILDKIRDNGLDINLPHYSNFLKSIKKLIFFLFRLNLYQTEINRQLFFKQQSRIAFVDSTPLSVCKVIRSSRHKTMEEYAEYSKSTTGWFYGLKLHLTTDWKTKEVLDFKFSNAKLDDRQYLKEILQDSNKFLNSETLFIADKGY